MFDGISERKMTLQIWQILSKLTIVIYNFPLNEPAGR